MTFVPSAIFPPFTAGASFAPHPLVKKSFLGKTNPGCFPGLLPWRMTRVFFLVFLKAEG
jgi:hypothetical protein